MLRAEIRRMSGRRLGIAVAVFGGGCRFRRWNVSGADGSNLDGSRLR